MRRGAEGVRELKEKLHYPRYTSLRRAFTIWVRRVLLRRIVSDEAIPEVNELEEVNAMLAERVTQWTDNWKREGQAAILQLQLLQRFGNILDQDIQDRLQHARPEQLKTWAKRIPDVRSNDEMFARELALDDD